jgi:hypothetical protein
MGDVIVVVFGVLLVAATVVVLRRQGSPGRLSDHGSPRRNRDGSRDPVTGRPAGPDAEDTGVAGPGQPRPRPAEPPEGEVT